MSKKSHYVIARQWDQSKPITEGQNLCIYAYGREIQYGDRASAEGMLDYVRAMEPAEAKEYGIYKIKIKELKCKKHSKSGTV